MEKCDMALRGNSMKLKIISMAILIIISFPVVQSVCKKCPSQSSPWRYGQSQDFCQFDNIMNDLKKLQENPVFQRSTDVLKVLNEWNAFVAGQLKKINDIQPEQIKMLTEQYDHLRNACSELNNKVKHKVELLESVIWLKSDKQADSSSIRNTSQNVIDKLKEDLNAVFKNTEMLNGTLEEQIIKTLNGSVKRDVKDLNAGMKMIEHNQNEQGNTLQMLKKTVQMLEEGSRAVKTDVLTQGETNKQSEEQTDKALQELTKQMREDQEMFRTNIDMLSSTAESTRNISSTNKRAIEILKDLAETRYKEIKELRNLTAEMQNKLWYYDVGGLSLLAFCLWVIVRKYMRNEEHARDVRASRSDGRQTRRDNKDAITLKWNGLMENSVCVVSFHSETDTLHVTETKSVFDSATLPMVSSRVIRSHADIRDLPGSRVFLVFVDFNERNVILEDPAKGLGDLRLITVKSLWQFGGDVFVIYCGDKRSKYLTGELFNQDLTSIYSQPELTQLKNQHRMLSIYQHFSDFQKRHCREIINDRLFKA